VHKRHTLVAIVDDHPGVMNRVVSLFRRRGFNIESITVGQTEVPQISRMTIVVDASNVEIDQVIKQLYKLLEVRKVTDLTNDPSIERELALIKIAATAQTRAEIMQMVSIYEAKIVDVTRNTLVVELASSVAKIDSLLSLLRPFGIKELARTGRVAMARGASEIMSVRDEALA
jgi:acetolactate synthase-1/3 small subunit